MRTILHARRPPDRWAFNDADFARYSKSDPDGRLVPYWRCPVALVHGGIWSKLLWRVSPHKGRARRGGGAITSVLPVLAAHTFPGKSSAGVASDDPNWTRWKHLSHRKIATLAGVNKDTVTASFRGLRARGFLQTREAPWFDNPNPPHALEYRLQRLFLYPSSGKEYAEIPLALFYSGLWASLRTPATRQLYLAIACLDPVRNEAAFPLTDRQLAEHGSRASALEAIRGEHPMTLPLLMGASGLTRNTVRAGLAELTEPRIGPGGVRMAPVRCHTAPGDRSRRWYTINREALTVPWYAAAGAEPARVNEPDIGGPASRTRGVNGSDLSSVYSESA
jgi:hypothetical protein